MIEQVVSHPAARFTRCRKCGRVPQHIRSRGRSSKEPVQFMATGHRHSIECACGLRTSRQLTLASAECEWSSQCGQLTLASAECEWSSQCGQLALPPQLPAQRQVA